MLESGSSPTGDACISGGAPPPLGTGDFWVHVDTLEHQGPCTQQASTKRKALKGCAEDKENRESCEPMQDLDFFFENLSAPLSCVGTGSDLHS